MCNSQNKSLSVQPVAPTASPITLNHGAPLEQTAVDSAFLAELWLAMISAPLPCPPSVSISHGWPHCSAPQASLEPHCATQAASGFPDSVKKPCRREKEMPWESLQPMAHTHVAALLFFSNLGYMRYIVGFFFCHRLPPFRVKPCYLVESAPWWGGNATEWLGEISNHRTGPAERSFPFTPNSGEEAEGWFSSLHVMRPPARHTKLN